MRQGDDFQKQDTKDSKLILMRRDKEGKILHFNQLTMLTDSVNQKDSTILNIYAPKHWYTQIYIHRRAGWNTGEW